jgi:hypothetical protein
MNRCHHCSSGRRHCGHGHCHDYEDTRWAIPAGGVLLALALTGIIREHGHGAAQAIRAAGYTVFALSLAACVITLAIRTRRRARARRQAPGTPDLTAITGPGRAGLPGQDGTRRAITGSTARPGRLGAGRAWAPPPGRHDGDHRGAGW